MSILLLGACKINRVTVTLKNVSAYDFKSIEVKLGDTSRIFRDLKKGESTKPFFANRAYRYCPATIIFSNNDTFIFDPPDFVGERLYKYGKLRLTFNIEKDSAEKYGYIIIKKR